MLVVVVVVVAFGFLCPADVVLVLGLDFVNDSQAWVVVEGMSEQCCLVGILQRMFSSLGSVEDWDRPVEAAVLELDVAVPEPLASHMMVVVDVVLAAQSCQCGLLLPQLLLVASLELGGSLVAGPVPPEH